MRVFIFTHPFPQVQRNHKPSNFLVTGCTVVECSPPTSIFSKSKGEPGCSPRIIEKILRQRIALCKNELAGFSWHAALMWCSHCYVSPLDNIATVKCRVVIYPFGLKRVCSRCLSDVLKYEVISGQAPVFVVAGVKSLEQGGWSGFGPKKAIEL
jgi:hypothetical protein